MPDVLPWVLVFSAIALALVSGANDGGSLLAFGIRFPAIPVAGFIGISAMMIVVGPLVFGVGVARTVAHELVPSHAEASLAAFAIGVLVTLVVVGALTFWGLPTSLTLALIGALTGAAIGMGLPIHWAVVGLVLGIGAIAPIVGGGLGWGLSAIARRATLLPHPHRMWRRIHIGAFALQCLAYAVNDGQKMLAVAAVAAIAVPSKIMILDGSHDGSLVVVLLAAAALFSIGTLWTLRRVSKRLARDLAQVRPIDAIMAELCASGAVLGSAALGAPVSMTQSMAAGLVGVVGSQGLRRVRWASVAQVAGAWIVTLPAAFALACGAAAVAAVMM